MENKEIFDWLEVNVLGLECEEKEKLKTLIAEVLRRIPEVDRFIFEKKGVRFVFPSSNCTAERIIVNPMISKDERYHPMVAIWLVVLNHNIYKEPKNHALYSIAHELAHVYLEHTARSSGKEESFQREGEADKQVIKWDFENELRQTPYNYIYGQGTIE